MLFSIFFPQIIAGPILIIEDVDYQLKKNFPNMNLKNIDFNKIPSLSKEILEKLNKFKPENLYDAGKISGITPSALFQIVKHKKIKGDRVA